MEMSDGHYVAPSSEATIVRWGGPNLNDICVYVLYMNICVYEYMYIYIFMNMYMHMYPV